MAYSTLKWFLWDRRHRITIIRARRKSLINKDKIRASYTFDHAVKLAWRRGRKYGGRFGSREVGRVYFFWSHVSEFRGKTR